MGQDLCKGRLGDPHLTVPCVDFFPMALEGLGHETGKPEIWQVNSLPVVNARNLVV